jgi:ferric-dicitrate binding protein FerR (iron transport regulator)
MTMNCAEWEEKLNAALDGELSDPDRALLEAHLAACADCRRTSDAIRAQSAELEALRFDSRALEERIIAAVQADAMPRRSRFRGLLPLAAAAAAILVACFLLLTPRDEPARSRPWMVLVSATGPVERRIGELWYPLPSSSGIGPDMQIRTSDGSKCEISCLDGSLLRLNSSTEIQIQDPRTIHLQEGELFAKVASAPQPFRFTTADGGLRTEGGVFDLSYRRPNQPLSKFRPPAFGTSLAVLEGKAMIGEQEVPTPMSCTMMGKTAGSLEPVDPLLRTRWVHDLLKLKDRNDPETAERVTALLAKLGRTKTPDVYEREIRSLGERSAPALLALVTKLPEDLSAYDRREAARLLSDLAGPSEVEALVKLIRDGDGDVWTSADRALTRITGKKLKAPEAWETWFKENRDSWAAPKK